MRISQFVALLFSLSPTFLVQAQDNMIDGSTNRVEISSYRGPELKSYAQMLKGLIAYKDKQQYAPNSELYFILVPKSKKVNMEGLTMRLASDDSSLNIRIDASGKFQNR